MAGTSAAASAQPQEGIEQSEGAVAASEKDASEDSDGECDECGGVPAELCAQCGSVVCERCGWQGKHSTEAVGQLVSRGTVPVFSLEKDLTVSLCPAVEAREKLEADRARGEVITGDTFTRDAISRHDYDTQTCVTTGDAPSRVQGQPAESSAERKE